MVCRTSSAFGFWGWKSTADERVGPKFHVHGQSDYKIVCWISRVSERLFTLYAPLPSITQRLRSLHVFVLVSKRQTAKRVKYEKIKNFPPLIGDDLSIIFQVFFPLKAVSAIRLHHTTSICQTNQPPWSSTIEYSKLMISSTLFRWVANKTIIEKNPIGKSNYLLVKSVMSR